jgi:hypothetical protein
MDHQRFPLIPGGGELQQLFDMGRRRQDMAFYRRFNVGNGYAQMPLRRDLIWPRDGRAPGENCHQRSRAIGAHRIDHLCERANVKARHFTSPQKPWANMPHISSIA